MTETPDVTLETITGAQVKQIRTSYNIGRNEFMQMCGFPGKSPARITNIEEKDSWKPGDKETVLATLQRLLANPPKEKNGRLRGESATARVDRLQNMLGQRKAPPPLTDDAGPVNIINPDTIPADTLISEEDEPPSMSSVVDEPDVVVPFHLKYAHKIETTDAPVVGVMSISDEEGLRVITNSEVSVAQRCRRRWWLSFFRQLAPKETNWFGPRAIGNRVHRALAAWYVPEGQERTDPREALERAIVEDWTALVAQERQKASYVDDGESLAELNARFQDAVSLERAMIEGYVEWIAEKGDDAQLLVTSPEAEVSVVIEGKVAGDEVRFRALGKLDVRLTRVQDGVRLFEDHKTVGNFTEPRKTLHMDPQMLHYHLLEWLSTQEGEARCDGALYNMLRKVKRTARAKEPFYERVEVHHNAYEINAYGRRLMGAARDIMRMEQELRDGGDPMSIVYPNPRHECSWDCDFFAVCPMFDDGSRVEDALASLYTQVDPLARYDRSMSEEA